MSDFELKKNNAIDLESKFLQRVKFWNENFTTLLDFEVKTIHLVSFKRKKNKNTRFPTLN